MNKDFVRDQNPTSLYHADQALGLPAYVKEASVITADDLSKLHSSAFADSVRKLHPIHNKVAALLSGVYLAGEGETEGKVWENVKKACVFYGVEDDLYALAAVFADTKEAGEAEPEQLKWAVHVQWNAEEVGSYYPINNAEEIKTAAVNLDKDYAEDRMPIEVFRKGAINVMKAASEQNVPTTAIPWTVREAGTVRLPNLDYVDLMLVTRKEAGVPAEGLELYRKCIAIAKEASTDTAVEQAIAIWRDLDEQHGLSYKKQANGFRVPSPYECFYTGMTIEDLEKTAKEHVVLQGVMIPYEDFSKALWNPETNTIVPEFHRAFGKEAAEQVTAALKELPNLRTYQDSPTKCSNDLAELPTWQQKRLLEVVLKSAGEVPAAATPTAPAMPKSVSGSAATSSTTAAVPKPPTNPALSKLLQPGIGAEMDHTIKTPSSGIAAARG
jgi:hypothetical protein